MAGSDWLAARRTEVAADRILDAAEQLFTANDPTSVGMNEIARAAGCSRATLYRYFENRDALHTAYVHRETYRLHDVITEKIRGIHDPRERLVAGVITTLRLVRESPPLSSWFAATRPPLGAEMAERSEVITKLAAAFVNQLGNDDPALVERRARWLVRVITSLLIFPGHDDTDEQRMIEEFVVPVITGRLSRAPE
ncbi:TetR/AcrR family transcriptional regulator [Mycobacterium shimoidei]|uniref:TetR/AcrR family transcriptional regulator n=1 Tax=Mycobacterium shimoidei TaxID=29313 RepID=UPI000848862A|nr:TetR/AcrR family transcriptional regulator [Mycobacterium shimoidei]MCV7257443.1 TetR/AcrR family transcriptional regulator [Mycobacterium shimoidei]ODR13929.1 TetR family transcriptional regulator [Mycobacterium shimoidei]ORW77557.1 TetR family transcriptional regulator [Mycobacterium shimoidei]